MQAVRGVAAERAIMVALPLERRSVVARPFKAALRMQTIAGNGSRSLIARQTAKCVMTA